MSNISTIIDTIRSRIVTLTNFTSSDKTEIPNPYSLEDNDENLLREGWGLVVSDASVASSEFKSFAEQRNFTIVITKELFRVEHDVLPMVNCSKAILEDQVTLKKDFLNNIQLGIADNIDVVDLNDSSGIEFKSAGKFNFLTGSVTFAFQIREDL